MGYGIEAAISAKIGDKNLSELLNDEEFSVKFENCLDHLRDHNVELPKKITKPDFFNYLSYFGSFSNAAPSYDSIKEHLLYDDYYIGSPLIAFEFLVSMAYLSAENPKSIISAGIGDSEVFWLDIKFKNGILHTIDRYYYDWDKAENVKFGSDTPNEDAFTCSEEEMRDFFSISIKERLKKLAAPDLFAEFDINTDKIDLSNKNLKEIGESIIKFKNLKELNLNGNRFKKIPEVILKLKGLVKLDFRNNQLTEIIEGFSTLKSLEVVDLSNNNIKEIPDEFCKLENLKDFEIGSNKLKTLPNSFGNLKKLERFWVSDNELEKFPESICNLNKLKELGFIRNRNFYKLPDNFGELKNLETLRIEHLQLKKLPNSFSKLDKLKNIDFHCNPLEGFPEVLVQMKNLEILKIGAHSVIKSIPESICQMECLKRLVLRDCRELEILPESIGKLNKLEELNISNTKVSMLPDSIGKLKKLKELSISQTHITKLPDSLKELEDLEIDSDKGRFIINESDQLSLVEPRGKEVDTFNKEITDEKEFFEIDSFRIGNVFKFCSKELRSNKDLIKKFTKYATKSTGYDGLGLEYMDDSLKADKEFAKELMLFDKSGWNIRFFNEEIRSDKELIKMAVFGDGEMMGELSHINFASNKLKNDESFLLELFEKTGFLYEFFPEKLKNEKEYALKAVTYTSQVFEYVPDKLKQDEDILLALLKDIYFGGTEYIPDSFKKDRWFIVKGVIVHNLKKLSDVIIALHKNDDLIVKLLTLDKSDKIEFLKSYAKDNDLSIDVNNILE